MTTQIPSHVRIGTQSWDLSGSDGLGEVRSDPDFFSRGLSLTDDRYLGSGTFDSGINYSQYQQKRKIEWPHKGYITSYPIRVFNDSVNTYFKHSVVTAGGSAAAIVSTKDCGMLIWYSRTPGGEPKPNINGTKRVELFEETIKVNRLYQRYSILDAKNSKGDVGVPGYDGNDSKGRGDELVVPIINKTYYINFAGVPNSVAQQCATKIGNTVNTNPRAPRADELVNFPASDIGGRSTLSFICQASTIWVDYDTYLRNVT
jgi:hypothetical protein